MANTDPTHTLTGLGPGDQTGARGLTDQDRSILDAVDQYLKRGLEVYEWWQKTNRTDAYADRFPLEYQQQASEDNFGFIDQVNLHDAPLPIMGATQAVAGRLSGPNRQTRSAGRRMRDRVREFMLRYCLRIAGSMESRIWSYSQRYYKLRGTGEIGKFGTTIPTRVRSTSTPKSDTCTPAVWRLVVAGKLSM